MVRRLIRQLDVETHTHRRICNSPVYALFISTWGQVTYGTPRSPASTDERTACGGESQRGARIWNRDLYGVVKVRVQQRTLEKVTHNHCITGTELEMARSRPNRKRPAHTVASLQAPSYNGRGNCWTPLLTESLVGTTETGVPRMKYAEDHALLLQYHLLLGRRKRSSCAPRKETNYRTYST